MGISTSIGILSQIVDRYESDGGLVQGADVSTSERADSDGLSASIDVAVPLCAAAEQPETEPVPETASLGDDGALRLEFPSSIVPTMDEYAPDGVSTAREDVSVSADGTVVVTFSLGFEADPEPNAVDPVASTDPELDSDTDATPADSDRRRPNPASAETATETSSPARGTSTTPASEAEDEDETEREAKLGIEPETERELEDARNEDLPPYEDVEYLQCLYDSLDTFAVMADVLEMDVASETVRRYMIDAGIHDPASYDTTSEEDAQPAMVEAEGSAAEADGQQSDADPTTAADESDSESAQPEEIHPAEHVPEKPLLADGAGLPDDVDVDELMDAIESSMTLYDVHRQLDLDRSQTRELLERLDLIDLVVKRVYDSNAPERSPSRDEIASRIRESVASEQHGPDRMPTNPQSERSSKPRSVRP
ncbi:MULTISPECIES: hypothetical protein [Natrialbaceae]|uniref:hypothetical protein n=1 Tax=Natrialbaceae TaxID=1644061 RepID=UPI00207D526D|nr:hypothetical protein [Natronococcus sp. CG52]